MAKTKTARKSKEQIKKDDAKAFAQNFQALGTNEQDQIFGAMLRAMLLGTRDNDKPYTPAQ